MEKFTDYQIVLADSIENLATEVKNLMAIGWQPIGGHSLSQNPVSSKTPEATIHVETRVSQAMVR